MQNDLKNTFSEIEFDAGRFVSADGIGRRGLAAAQPLLEGAVAVKERIFIELDVGL